MQECESLVATGTADTQVIKVKYAFAYTLRHSKTDLVDFTRLDIFCVRSRSSVSMAPTHLLVCCAIIICRAFDTTTDLGISFPQNIAIGEFSFSYDLEICVMTVDNILY